jgi:two-component system, OmpR family, response regulator
MATDKRYIFLVDDEPIQNEMLKDYLNERFVYEIKTFDNGEDMLQNMHLSPEIVVLDYHLSAHKTNAKNGVEILKLLKDKYPAVQVIMLSGQDKIDVAIDSMKYGAYDYVVKGETAFSRTENILNNVSELHKMRTINRAYKRTITLLTISLILIIALAIGLYWYMTNTAY